MGSLPSDANPAHASGFRGRIGSVSGAMLDIASHVFLFCFFYFSLMVLFELVHALGHSDARHSLIRILFDDNIGDTHGNHLFSLLNWIPSWYSTTPFCVVILLFACFAPASLRRRTSNSTPPFSGSRLFLYGSATVAILLGLFWAVQRPGYYGYLYSGVSMILIGTLALGAVAGFVVKKRQRWSLWGALTPPLLCMLPFVGVALWIAAESEWQTSSFPDAWPLSSYMLLHVLIGGGIGMGLVYWERAATGRINRSLRLIESYCWFLVGLMAYGTLLPFHHLCLVMGPNRIQDIACILILAASAVVVCSRTGIGLLRGRVATSVGVNAA